MGTCLVQASSRRVRLDSWERPLMLVLLYRTLSSTSRCSLVSVVACRQAECKQAQWLEPAEPAAKWQRPFEQHRATVQPL